MTRATWQRGPLSLGVGRVGKGSRFLRVGLRATLSGECESVRRLASSDLSAVEGYNTSAGQIVLTAGQSVAWDVRVTFPVGATAVNLVVGDAPPLRVELPATGGTADSSAPRVTPAPAAATGIGSVADSILDAFADLNPRFPDAVVISPPDFDVPGVAVAETPRERIYVVDASVLFDFDMAVIRPDAIEALELIAGQILGAGDADRIEVGGHTDAVGSDAYNQDLSERRAGAVSEWLGTRLGQPPIDAIGFGEQFPIAPNENADGSDNPDGRQLNRRVEIVVTLTD